MSEPFISADILLELTLRSFDADLPLVCDDEDLSDSGLDSPEANRPTRVCCFAAAIKLSQIFAFAIRTIVRQPSLLSGVFNDRLGYSIQRGGRESFSVTPENVGRRMSLPPSIQP